MSNLTGLVNVLEIEESKIRTVVEVTPRIKHITVFKGIPLENHYHKMTGETFYVIQGDFEIKLENPETREREFYVIRPGQSIDIPVLAAHKVIARPGTEFLSILDRDFDPADHFRYDIFW